VKRSAGTGLTRMKGKKTKVKPGVIQEVYITADLEGGGA
jgi:hypothetical protein